MEQDSPSHFRRYVMNSHDEADAVSVVITPEMLEALEHIHLVSPYIRKLVSCDPSEGGDECIIKGFINSEEIEQKVLHEKDQRIIAGDIEAMCVRLNTKNCAVDTLGCGGEVVGILTERGYKVIRIDSREPASDPMRFFNRRTEMWWYVANEMRQKRLYAVRDAETRRQLCAVRYETARNDRVIKLEPKKYTKKILRRSPDRADCYIYGIWALQYVQPDNSPPPQSFTYKKTMLQSSGRR